MCTAEVIMGKLISNISHKFLLRALHMHLSLPHRSQNPSYAPDIVTCEWGVRVGMGLVMDATR